MIMKIYFIQKVSQITSNHQIGLTRCFYILNLNILRNFGCFRAFFSQNTLYWINSGSILRNQEYFKKYLSILFENCSNCGPDELEWINKICNVFERFSVELDILKYHKISKVYRFLAKKGVKFRKPRKYTKIMSTNLHKLKIDGLV